MNTYNPKGGDPPMSKTVSEYKTRITTDGEGNVLDVRVEVRGASVAEAQRQLAKAAEELGKVEGDRPDNTATVHRVGP